MPKKRTRIGFLTQAGYQNYQSEMLAGVVDAAVMHDADIVRLTLETNFSYYLHDSTAYDSLEFMCALADELDLDGLLLLGWLSSPQKVQSCLKKSAGIPIVLLGSWLPEYTSVFMDGLLYIREIISHLATDHDRKRIAFVEPVNPDSRVEEYTRMMKKFGLFRPEYIISNTDISLTKDLGFSDRADRTVKAIYDEKKLEPDAIMVMHANDAVCIVENLIARNIRVPEDVSVTGWEEGDVCRYNDPPVTTVYFPFREIGYTGCDVLARTLSGEKTAQEYIVPGRIIRRKSCGCRPAAMEKATTDIVNPGGAVLPFDLQDRVKVIAGCAETFTMLDPEELLNVFISALTNKESEAFISWIDAKINARQITIEQVNTLRDEILTFRGFVKPCIRSIDASGTAAEDIWIKTQIMLGGKIERILGNRERYKIQYASKVEEIGLYLNTVFDMGKIKNILSTYLQKIKIDHCTIYGITSDTPGTMKSKLIYTFPHASGRSNDDDAFSGSVLFPPESRHTYILHALRVDDKIIGCVFFDYGSEDDRIYLTLATQLSSAIYGAANLKTIEESVREKDVLMKELQHRVKNNLMTIISLLNLERGKLRNNAARQVFQEAENRIHSMTMIYEKLYQPSSNLLEINLDEYLVELSVQLLQNYDVSAGSIALTSDLEKIRLDMKRCVCLGLITNEVITNSIKYAFPSGEGTIRIKLEKTENTITIEYSDDGIGIGGGYDPEKTDNFGLQLVRMNVMQLEGTMKISNGENGGTTVRIAFPFKP